MRLIEALEPVAADAAVGQDTAADTIGAAFTVDAPDAGAALEEGRRLFGVALDQVGLSRGELVELHVARLPWPRMTPGAELVSGAEIARRLNVSRERVRQWAASPKLGLPRRSGQDRALGGVGVATGGSLGQQRRAPEQPKT